MRLASVTLAAFAFVSTAVGQQTIVVDASGGGDFAQIQPAINAAARGDVIVVRPGTYPSFQVGKGVRILADPGVTLTDHLGSLVAVRGVPANHALVVRGFRQASVYGLAFLVENCAGHVHLEDVASSHSPVGYGIRVVNSRQVSLHRVVVGGLPAVEVVSSTVSIGQSGLAGLNATFQPAGRGLVCRDSNVAFAEGSCIGGRDSLGLAGPAPGVVVESGTVTIAGDAATTIAAGINASGPVPTPALEVLGGRVILEPAVTLEPSHGGPPTGGPGTIDVRRTGSVRATVTGQQLDGRVHAQDAFLAHTLIDSPLQPAVPIPAIGTLWFDVSHIVLDSGAVPPSGVRAFSVQLPQLPAGFVAVVQSIVLPQPNVVLLSTPAVVTLP